MKKYLFGLGATLVGAGLMFVFTHTEVSADSEMNKPEPFVCSEKSNAFHNRRIVNCKTKTTECAVLSMGVSCVKSECI